MQTVLERKDNPVRAKSGLRKREALRNMPISRFGFRANPATKPYRNPAIGESDQSLTTDPFEVVSLFCGCGGLDPGLLWGVKELNDFFQPFPLPILQGDVTRQKNLDTHLVDPGHRTEIS